MKYGFFMPPDDPQSVVNFGIKAEQLGWDGIIPYIKPKGKKGRSTTPDDIGEIKSWLVEHNHEQADIVIEGETPGDNQKRGHAVVQAFIDAGATWWIESIWDNPGKRETRLFQGPPC